MTFINEDSFKPMVFVIGLSVENAYEHIETLGEEDHLTIK